MVASRPSGHWVEGATRAVRNLIQTKVTGRSLFRQSMALSLCLCGASITPTWSPGEDEDEDEDEIYPHARPRSYLVSLSSHSHNASAIRGQPWPTEEAGGGNPRNDGFSLARSLVCESRPRYCTRTCTWLGDCTLLASSTLLAVVTRLATQPPPMPTSTYLQCPLLLYLTPA